MTSQLCCDKCGELFHVVRIMSYRIRLFLFVLHLDFFVVDISCRRDIKMKYRKNMSGLTYYVSDDYYSVFISAHLSDNYAYLNKKRSKNGSLPRREKERRGGRERGGEKG